MAIGIGTAVFLDFWTVFSAKNIYFNIFLIGLVLEEEKKTAALLGFGDLCEGKIFRNGGGLASPWQ